MAVTFLAGVLTSAQLRVRFAFGVDPRSDPTGWTWTDLTSDVQQDNGRTIEITIGKGAESPTAPPAQCMLALDNRSGNYTQFSGKSIYYPNIREGTPMWVEVFVSGTWHTRFFGFCKGFSPAWDVTGNYAISKVEAYGVTRRQTQGKAPLRSALYRAIADGNNTYGTPLAYWPMEDGSGANQLASAVSGVQPGSVTGSVGFGSAEGPPGSAPVADFSQGGSATFVVNAPTPTAYRIELAVRFPAIPTGQSITFMRLTFDGATSLAILTVDFIAQPNAAGGINYVINLTGGTFPIVGASSGGVEDAWHWITFEVVVGGGFVNVPLYIDNVLVNPGTGIAASIDRLTTITVNPTGLPDRNAPAIGHLSVWPQAASDTYTAYTGNAGETAQARLIRLAAEQGETFATVGTYVAKATMGAQGVDSFITLLRECELADAGYLYDGLSSGLQFQGIADRYNATSALTLNAAIGEVQPDFTPVGDDLGRCNDMTVSRKNGSSARYTDTAGNLGTDNVGVYDNSIEINIESDGPLARRAGWEVSKGTLEGFRYPSLGINIRKIPTKVLNWLAVLPGSTITVNPPYSAQLPTDDILLVVEGWTERLTNLRWEIDPINCSLAQIYQQVGVYASAIGSTTDKFDLENSFTNATSTTTATSIVVKVIGDALWTTNSSEMPFDLNINGERVRVTAVSGASSPQTMTVTRSVNGVVKSHVANEPVHLWTPTRFGL